MTNENHRLALQKLKNNGIEPNVIFDIGAHRGLWSKVACNVFNNSSFYLFEACDTRIKCLENTGFKYYIAALGDVDNKQTIFYKTKKDLLCTGDSFLKEKNNKAYEGGLLHEKIVTMRTLDKFISDNNIPYPDFIKIDTQGSEIMVMEGGLECLKSADFVLLEVSYVEYNENCPLFEEVEKYMIDHGFIYQYNVSRSQKQGDVLFSKIQLK